MNAKELHRLLTITAFTIGYVLIDELTATEQNAVGNFFMLIGQTLSTNSSFNFNVDWNNATNGTSVKTSVVDGLSKFAVIAGTSK